MQAIFHLPEKRRLAGLPQRLGRGFGRRMSQKSKANLRSHTEEYIVELCLPSSIAFSGSTEDLSASRDAFHLCFTATCFQQLSS